MVLSLPLPERVGLSETLAHHRFRKFNLNNSCDRRINNCVRWLKAVSMFVLLALWLSASNHCYLELAGILPPDNCHTEEKSSSSSGDPCESGCKVTEKAGYKTQDHEKLVLLAVMLPLVIEFEPAAQVLPNQFSKITTWPPETLHLPQFLIRTALPVRGPSLVS